MSQINPFSGYLQQSAQIQRDQSVAKDRRVGRARAVRKHADSLDVDLGYHVEGAGRVSPAGDAPKDDRRGRGRKRPAPTGPGKDANTPHIDVVG